MAQRRGKVGHQQLWDLRLVHGLKRELALALGACLEALDPRLHVGKTCGEA